MLKHLLLSLILAKDKITNDKWRNYTSVESRNLHVCVEGEVVDALTKSVTLITKIFLTDIMKSNQNYLTKNNLVTGTVMHHIQIHQKN